MLENPFQTVQMTNKQTLMLKKKDDTDIIAINTSSSSYVDEDYFKNVMGEDTKDPTYLTFAVKI